MNDLNFIKVVDGKFSRSSAFIGTVITELMVQSTNNISITVCEIVKGAKC